jgi:hypothetical protein
MNKNLARLLWQQYRGHLLSFAAGVLVGVMFANWLRGIVTVFFVLLVLLALYFVWVYFDNPSCHLQNTGQALEVVGKDEAPDFEHKALEGGGMNPLGE